MLRQETAILAAGCFWGVEDLIMSLPGVISTEVGYTGGGLDRPVYEQVKTGKTGHAEAVKIVFNPDELTYEDLLRHFFRLHDPTTPNRQGNDVGTQYRSAIFVYSDDQRAKAENVKREIQDSGRWKGTITTAIVPTAEFFSAEESHQQYLKKNPGGYSCHFFRW